jgi:hypothetical protein
MSHSVADVEDRLRHSLCAFVSGVPEHPPVAWPTYVAATKRTRYRLHALVGVAASIVLIALATVLWSTPSAGDRPHGGDAVGAATAASSMPIQPLSADFVPG